MADMKNLPSEVLEWSTGFCVQWNDDSPFSSVDIDHATEWLNGTSKAFGGLATITQNDRATLKYDNIKILTISV